MKPLTLIVAKFINSYIHLIIVESPALRSHRKLLRIIKGDNTRQWFFKASTMPFNTDHRFHQLWRAVFFLSFIDLLSLPLLACIYNTIDTIVPFGCPELRILGYIYIHIYSCSLTGSSDKPNPLLHRPPLGLKVELIQFIIN